MSHDLPRVATGSRARFKFKDAGTLALASRVGLYVCALLAVVATASSWAHRTLLEDIQSGAVTVVESDENLTVRDVSDAREAFVSYAQTIALLATAVVTMMWTYRANANLRALTIKPLQFTPGWAVGWYFVPIASWWKPYQMMKELWVRSADELKEPAKSPWYLIVWWLGYNAMLIASRISSRMFLRAKTTEEEIDAHAVDIVACVLVLPAALLFARLIQRIQAMQVVQLERNLAAGSMTPVEEAPWR